MVCIQLPLVLRSQADQLNSGGFLLSSMEKLSPLVYCGVVTAPVRETLGPCQMISGFPSLTWGGWLMWWSRGPTQRPPGQAGHMDSVEWSGVESGPGGASAPSDGDEQFLPCWMRARCCHWCQLVKMVKNADVQWKCPVLHALSRSGHGGEKGTVSS